MKTRGADGERVFVAIPLPSLQSCYEKQPSERRFLALSAHAPAQAGPLKQAGFTPLKGVQLDIRYATTHNFTGAVLPGYCKPMALLRKPAAAALQRVVAKLPNGYGLRIFDAYRPARATRAMVRWAETTGHESVLSDGWVARKSNHNRGAAVDLTLTKNGKPLAMGTGFDTFSTRSYFANASGKTLQNRKRLRTAMEREGFRNYAHEWWHYDFPPVTAGPVDIPLGC